MKQRSMIKYFFFLFFVLAIKTHAQNAVNWTPEQLIEPITLATTITKQKDIPLVISVGPGAVIPNSLNAGIANTKEGIEKLKEQLQNVDRNKKVVIYCGCCPFEHCPNVRPAIDVLKEMKFTNYYLLDLPHNIKKDWIDKGYPVSKS